MRVARAIQSGRGQNPLFLYGPNNIFVRKLASNATLATDQTPALKLANQLNYANPNYSYDGSAAPSFYGYSGMGYGGNVNGFQTVVGYKTFSIPLYIVDSSVSTQTVTYVNYAVSNGQSAGTNYLANTFTVFPAGWSNNLQAGFNAVPVPDVTKILRGQIQADGTDGHVVIWRPSTNELWEMWRFNGTPGSYNFGYGAHTSNASNFNGIWSNGWGARATGLASAGGIITIQDIIDVQRGGSINHALGLSIPVTANAAVAPAVRHDSTSHNPQFEADGTTPNPAYGMVDAVSESCWFRLPASFDPVASMPTSGPVARAIATAIRDYGMFVNDGGGACVINMEEPRALGSPYSYAKINPFAGGASDYNATINSIVPSSWTDSTLPLVTEVMSGTSSVLSKIPWQQLQQLQPFSS